MIRNIIFDWSGTLVDDLPAVLAATNAVFEECGVEKLSLEKFRSEFCLPFKHFYDRFVPNVPLADLERSFHGHFRLVQDQVAALPHAREFLLFCRNSGLRTFILSTVHKDYFALQSKAQGFDKFIERAYTGIWDKRLKIVEVLTENQLVAGETLFIGDMQHDVETARHGGVRSCAVLTGYNRLDQLRASEPDVIVEHLGELRQILERDRMEWKPLEDGVGGAHPICTVGALIFNDDRMLMIRTQKWSNLWGIPGGKIKFGEPSVRALEREIKEETNLDIGEIIFVMAQDCIQSTEFYRRAHFVLLNYTCRARGPVEVRLNEEAQEFRWVTAAQALEMPLNQPTRTLLEKVFQSGS
ncbi:MAG TPA: NUDIX domain-containing protein [Verrucomicrobiae bacterium]|jgi:phosphoglycolate phosphatase-like HAD superfamily hydrolase/ADP-ribose pyrophosphatase YjhB (NUDIX family)|nr:NUDIX domain-containing protein [Verrucomicrobiae bacterium]